MTEHAEEVINLLLWFIGIGGVAFLALAKWSAGQLMSKLEAIESAIKQTNTTLGTIEGDLRSEVAGLERRHEEKFVSHDRRIGKIEAACQHYHALGKD